MFTSSNFPMVSQEIHFSPTGVPTTHNGWNHQPAPVIPGLVFPQPRVTRFSGASTYSSASYPPKEAPDLQLLLWNPSNENFLSDSNPSEMKSIKRKTEEPMAGLPRKQLITEDKIAAHMSQLQISPAPEQPASKPEIMDDEAPIFSEDTGVQLSPGSKLVLSEELRRLKHEPSLPTSLLESFQRPTMAVVLWQPRNTVTQQLLGNSVDRSETNTNRSEDAAGAATPRDEDADRIAIDEDDSNNNEPINDFNRVDQMLMYGQHPPDASMDEDL